MDSEAVGARARACNARYERSRVAILAAARDLFLARGYDINLDEVAAQAGVSKTTLYNHFGTKRSLLEAMVQASGEAFIADMSLGRSRDVRELLLRYGREFDRRSLSPEGNQFFRLIVSDVSKFPELAGAVYQTGIGRVLAALADELRKAIEAGKLKPVDPLRTAEQFLGAVTGVARHRAFGGPSDSVRARNAYIQDTVELFMAALAPADRDHGAG